VRVNDAMSGNTRAQLKDDAATPASNNTAGMPVPALTTCRRCRPTLIIVPGGTNARSARRSPMN
jgi:hypothetical protein